MSAETYHELSNGLRIAVAESHAAPVVALQVWVGVGAADERPDEAGLAHLHEHMLFKGTARRKTGEIAAEVESRGGEINAWTSHDQTVYHLVVASGFWREGLDLLADALRHSSFDPAELGRETQVVVEEIKRGEDSPARRLSRELFATVYQRHPYRLPVIGTPESVLGFRRPQILDFYHRHYIPNAMVVVVAGDVQAQAAVVEVDRHFGDWPRAASPDLQRAAEPPQLGPRVRLVRGGVRETRLALAFPIPGVLHSDVPALDVLAAVLAQGEGARLPRELRRRRQLFSEVHAYAYTPRDPGMWVAGGTTAPGKEREAIEALIGELELVRREEVDAASLARAKHQLESEQVYQRESAQGWARKAGYFATMAGGPEAEHAYQAHVQAVTAADLRAIVARYLTRPSANLVVLSGEGSDLSSNSPPLDEPALRELLERGLSGGAPTASPASAASWLTDRLGSEERTRAPAIDSPAGSPLVRTNLPSGGTLLVKLAPEVPLVALRAAYLGGVRSETEANNGLTALLSRCLTRGAAGRSADAIAATIDDLAGALGGASGRNSFGLSGVFLSRDWRAGLELFLDCLLAPEFPEAEVGRERALQLQAIRAREDNPAGLAFELFARTLFLHHPNRLPLAGEAESVSGLSSELLGRTWRERYPPSGLTLSVVGDVDPEALAEAVRARLPASSAAAEPVVASPEAPPSSPRQARRALEKAQTHLVVGFRGLDFRDPERYALQLLSSVLAGQGGRLFRELRDKRSLAYSVSAFSTEGVDPGYFAVYLGTSPEKRQAALLGIREQLERVRQEPVSTEELQRAQRYLIGAHAIGLQRRASVAGTLALDHCYGLGAESYLAHHARLSEVTADQLLAVAQRLLAPRGEVVAEVGPQVGSA